MSFRDGHKNTASIALCRNKKNPRRVSDGDRNKIDQYQRIRVDVPFLVTTRPSLVTASSIHT